MGNEADYKNKNILSQTWNIGLAVLINISNVNKRIKFIFYFSYFSFPSTSLEPLSCYTAFFLLLFFYLPW